MTSALWQATSVAPAHRQDASPKQARVRFFVLLIEELLGRAHSRRVAISQQARGAVSAKTNRRTCSR